MCGIFGFMMNQTISMDVILKVMGRLEVHKYREEQNPVGGYGAGMAILFDDGGIFHEKVGAVAVSPVRALSDVLKSRNISSASVMIGHVRFPSPEYISTARFRETAQPYVAQFDPSVAVASVHNGKIENFMQIRRELGTEHVLESEKVGLIDSEVIPHLFVEEMKETDSATEALDRLYESIQGSCSLGLLHADAGDVYMHLIHKGKTRGLNVWTNRDGEVLFCSRIEPVEQELSAMLKERKFHSKLHLLYREDVGVRLTFPRYPEAPASTEEIINFYR